MGKLVLILAVFGLITVSCRKNYTCECTFKSGATVYVSSSVIKDSRRKAEISCLKDDGNMIGYTKESCEIKE